MALLGWMTGTIEATALPRVQRLRDSDIALLSVAGMGIAQENCRCGSTARSKSYELERVQMSSQFETAARPERLDRSAVFSMTLAIMSVMGSELLPISLLTPIAADLQISPGEAGQTVTLCAIAAVATSVSVASVTRRADRRSVVIGLSILCVISNLLSAFASNFETLLTARIVLGVAHGGLWALVPAIAMRLAPEAVVGRALSMMFGGISAAMILVPPTGSFIGDHYGWRYAFYVTAGIALVSLVWQSFALPSMPQRTATSILTPFRLLKRGYVAVGVCAVILTYMGHYSNFTYIRPYLEKIPGIGAHGLPFLLLGYGIANFLGVTLAGHLLSRSVWMTLNCAPFMLGALAIAYLLVGPHAVPAGSLFIAYGFTYGLVPVAWSAWVTRVIPDEAESGGGLMVALSQTGIAMGAALGGYAFDAKGVLGAFGSAGVALACCAMMIRIAHRAWTRGQARGHWAASS
jgi:predicted MFS family arabinose efflux permease